MKRTVLTGIAAAEGVAIGPAFRYEPQTLALPNRLPEDRQGELLRYDEAIAQARDELETIRGRVAERAGEKLAAIFDAHMLMLEDPMLREAVVAKLDAGLPIESAVLEASEELAATLSAMQAELFAARAADVHDVGQRVLRLLLGLPDTSLSALVETAIVVAHDLTPSDTAQLDPDLVLGFCTAIGGLTSHTAILARTLGLPAVVGLGQSALSQIQDGQLLVLDGSNGQVILTPARDEVRRYRDRQMQESAKAEAALGQAHELTFTADGERVEVAANIGNVESALDAVRFGAEGVGLLRTEFLYLTNTRPPTEDEQIEAYRAIFQAMGDRPIIVRTLDIGGDKPPPYIEFGDELNPFLGWRAIRIALDDAGLFKTQLRAILRAAEGYRVLIMYPMISGVGELRRANAILDEVRSELLDEQTSFAQDVPVGIMVETPAAAVMADALAAECDFFSIGTNDLTQYTLACDRTNERVASLYQPLHPAVLRLIKQVLDAAHASNVWVGMCGELAGMPRAIPILLGLGLDEFSMVPRAIPAAKQIIQRTTRAEMAEVSRSALMLSTAEEVETLARETLDMLTG